MSEDAGAVEDACDPSAGGTSRSCWLRGGGVALDEWLRGTLSRFGAAPGDRAFQIQRPSRRVWHQNGAGNSSPYHLEFDNTYVDSIEALGTQFALLDVESVSLAVHAKDSWSLVAERDANANAGTDPDPGRRVRVIMPRAAGWPLPARLRDSEETYRLLDRLAALLGLTPPDPVPGPVARFPREVVVNGRVDSFRSDFRVTGLGDVPLRLYGETPRTVGRLGDLLAPSGPGTRWN